MMLTLSIRSKFMVMLAAAIIVIAALCADITRDAHEKYQQMKREDAALTFAKPIQILTANLARHERLLLGTLGTAATRSAEIEKAKQTLRATSEEVVNIAKTLHSDSSLAPQSAELARKIGAVVQLTQNLPKFAMNAAHEAAFAEVHEFSLTVSNEMRLFASPDVDFVYTYLAVFNRLPLVVGSRAELAASLGRYLDTQASAEKAGMVSTIGAAFQSIGKIEANYDALRRNMQEAEKTDDHKRGWSDISKVATGTSALLEEFHGEIRESLSNQKALGDLLQLDGKIVSSIQEVWTASIQVLTTAIERREREFIRDILIKLAIAISASLSIIAAMIITIRQFSGAFGRLKNEMGDVARGQLDIGITGIGRPDEFGEMSQALEGLRQTAMQQRILQQQAVAAAEQLQQVAGKIFESVEAIHVASAEIASGSNDLSARTEREASALQETVSVVVEIAATIASNSTISEQAREMSIRAAQTAASGGKVVGEVITAIKGIEESSRRISEIIVVMEEIAFQTKLLALNAAVEAARAGESGRGFAVVAQEVRSLADRSRQASLQIRELIANAARQVAEGVERANAAEGALTEIVTSAKKVAEIAPEIAASGREQTRSIEEVQRAMTDLDEATQQNAALVEESSAAAAAMAEQADNLANLVELLRGGQEVDMAKVTMKAPAKKPAQRVSSKPKSSQKPVPPVHAGNQPRALRDEDWERL